MSSSTWNLLQTLVTRRETEKQWSSTFSSGTITKWRLDHWVTVWLNWSQGGISSAWVCLGMTSNLTWHNCFWRAKMAGSYSVKGRQEQHSQGAVLHFPEPLHINDQNCHSLFTETISETHQFVCVWWVNFFTGGNLLFMIWFCDH